MSPRQWTRFPSDQSPWSGTGGQAVTSRCCSGREEVCGKSAVLDATKYAGHSLRAGHLTSAAIAGASERSIMNQTGHRSVQTVRRYIRDESLFRENSGANWDCSRKI